MIALPCPHCGKGLKVKDDLAGKKVKCPACQKPVAVPRPAASVSPVPATAGPPADERTLPPLAPAGAEERTLPPRDRDEAEEDSLSDSGAQTGLGDSPQGEPTQSLPAGGPDRELYDFLAPPQAADELGRLGGFRVLRVLGHGGMGVVFQAEDPKLGRKVAIKAMLPHLAGSRSSQERFLREARAAAALEHDHIVPIFHVGEDQGAPFIVMPFLKGESLDDRLQREEKLPVPEVLRIGREIALGLAAAHQRGLIHRDIKPANVWLEEETGRVKILDFGLARAAAGESGLTQQGAVIGTPAYMAPEQAAGEPVDARCDLFSLGCVLYRLCTGRPPFKGNDTVSTLVAVATENPDPPARINPEVPRPLSDLVMHLLAKKPGDRPPSAHAVADALRAIEGQTAELMGQPGPASRKGKAGVPHRPEAARTPPARPAKKRPALPWLVAGGVLGVAVLAAGLVLFWQTPHGTVRIECDDPAVEVVFDRTGPAIKGAEKEPITLRAGAHALLVKRGDFTFETDKLVVKKGEAVVLRVELLPGKVQLVRDGRMIASGDLPPAAKFTNNLGMEFVLVPKGKAWLGGGGGKRGTREVEVREDFYLGKYEVTQEEWEKVMAANPSSFARGGKDQELVKDVPDADLGRFPVETVSWTDAREFVRLLNEKVKEPGWVYRLPWSAEWEYACRGGPMADRGEGAFDYYFEKPTNDLLPALANFKHDKGLGRPCKVGSYPPNRLGLHDLHGNVTEWCEDEVFTREGASRRTLRGGSWADDAKECRAGEHHGNSPTVRLNVRGLRLARVPAGKEILKPAPEEKTPDEKTPEGETNYALRFKEHDQVEIPSLKLPAAGPLTVEAYVTILKGSASGGLVMGVKGQLMLSVTDNDRWHCTLSVKRPAPLVRLHKAAVLGERLHVACVRTDDELRLYQAGKLLGSKRLDAETAKDVRAPFKLGGGSFDGLIDEVRVSNAARYDKDFTPAERFEQDGDTLALYHCDEGRGDVLYDSSGHGHHGKVTGPTWVKADGSPVAAAPPGLKGVPPKDGRAALPATFTNGLGMEFVRVPRGRSWLGGGGKPGDQEVEMPHDFYLGKYEVTQEQWQKVTGLNPSIFKAGRPEVAGVPEGDLKHFPVENVSWDECRDFIARLNEKVKEDGWVYRLPKMAEWEYACRGGPLDDRRESAFDYYLDKPASLLLPQEANFRDAALQRPCKVGSYRPNRLGLYDLHGNVQEWCADEERAKDGTSVRAFRGGSWNDDAAHCRAAYHSVNPPSSRTRFRGLRLARVPAKGEGK